MVKKDQSGGSEHIGLSNILKQGLGAGTWAETIIRVPAAGGHHGAGPTLRSAGRVRAAGHPVNPPPRDTITEVFR